MDQSEDEFKLFREGFDGFPKILPDDCVEYTIYIIDLKLNDVEKRDRLRRIQTAGHKLISELTKDFIWQREGIHLTLERQGSQSLLRGRTNYGDSVEDEWLVVYILRELSQKFPDIWIRVVDTDGQFLLIEAAGVLPRWLNPEIADFRAWLNTGDLLIVPLDSCQAHNTQTDHAANALSLENSLHFLEKNRSKLINSPTIQAEVFYRLQKYPKQIMDSLHYAVVRIPRKVAYVLHENPASIVSAVEAFYLRDPVALRPLQVQEPSELLFPPRDFVSVSLKFTKVSYAQLKSQQFDPPRIWAEASTSKSGSLLGAEAAIGLKLSCGFEMLMSDPQNQDKKTVREINIILDDLHTEKDLLPSDTDILKWSMREDDEKWLDINFENFDRELGGFKGNKGAAAMNGGFGDKGVQENLRRMVARFEDFLNDDVAGAEGAEHPDDMDYDDDDDDDDNDDGDTASSDNSELINEDKDISFHEDDFTSMMREMMGLPASALTAGQSSEDKHINHERANSVSSHEGDDNALREDIQAIEKELHDAGALDLDLDQISNGSKPLEKNLDTRSNGTDRTEVSLAAEGADNDEDVDIDYNLAKNLLESFKSQGGVSGPGSNLMGMLGLRLPRDESEKD